MRDTSVRAREAARRKARVETLRPHVRQNRLFRDLHGTVAGDPVPVYSPSGHLEFWLVPFLIESTARGFVLLTDRLRLVRIGTFGSGTEDMPGLIDARYFSAPPAKQVCEIKAHYPLSQLSSPVFSYHRTPARWGWRIIVTKSDGTSVAVHVLPGGWYESGSDNVDLEGSQEMQKR